jgi:hypothetical protein
MKLTESVIGAILILLTCITQCPAQHKPLRIPDTDQFPGRGTERAPLHTPANQEKVAPEDSAVNWALERAKVAGKINLSILPGLESLPVKHFRSDTANFKPEYFRFPDIDKKNLSDRLETDVPLQTASCKPSWGIFAFRVNTSKKVDSTTYRGNLPFDVQTKILDNIYCTDGLWIVNPAAKPTNVAWYVYLYFDLRDTPFRESRCTDEEKELYSAVSQLSNLFYFLYYRINKNDERATFLIPSIIDGSIKL